MKKFKFLFSVAVASAFVGCSSMDPSDEEALAGNFPDDFSDAVYMQVHPELVRLQVKDYVIAYNGKLSDAATAAGEEALATFNAAKEADIAAFDADTALLHAIMVDPNLGGYTEADWTLDWGGGTKDTTIITTRKDTLSLTVGDSADPAAAQAVIVALAQSKGDSACVTVGKSKLCDTTLSVGSLEYDADGKLVALHGYSKCDSATLTCDAADTLDITLTATSFVKKPSKTDTITVVVSVENKTLDVEGAISAAHMKALDQLNFYDQADDLAALKAIPLDTFAISYQYVIFGRAHGWAYRPCTEAEQSNPAITEEYPVTKLYCDDNGLAREIN